MEELVYTFTKEDYDNLQKSLFTKDIIGSSWKGEEKIFIAADRINYYRNNILIKEYPLDHFVGFSLSPWWNTKIPSYGWERIVLFKKNEYKTEWEKNIRPALRSSGGTISRLYDGAEYIPILASKSAVVVAALEKILPYPKSNLDFMRLSYGKSTFSGGTIAKRFLSVFVGVIVVVILITLVTALANL